MYFLGEGPIPILTPEVCSASGLRGTGCAWTVGTCLLPSHYRDSFRKDGRCLQAFPAWCSNCKDRWLSRNLGSAWVAGRVVLVWHCKPWPDIKCLPGSSSTGISVAWQVRCCSRWVAKAPGCPSLRPTLQVTQCSSAGGTTWHVKIMVFTSPDWSCETLSNGGNWAGDGSRPLSWKRRPIVSNCLFKFSLSKASKVYFLNGGTIVSDPLLSLLVISAWHPKHFHANLHTWNLPLTPWNSPWSLKSLHFYLCLRHSVLHSIGTCWNLGEISTFILLQVFIREAIHFPCSENRVTNLHCSHFTW